MPWHTASSLTPVIAFDAATREANGNLTDLTGKSNHAQVYGQPVGVTVDVWPNTLKCIKGNGTNVAFTTTTNLPASGAIFALLRVNSQILLANGNGGSLFAGAVNAVSSSIYSSTGNAGTLVQPLRVSSYGFAWGAGYHRHFQNGQWLSDAATNNTLNATNGITYPGWGLNGDLVAYGMFSGNATLEDLATLDSAARTELASTEVYASKVLTQLGHTNKQTNVFVIQNYSKYGRTVGAQEDPASIARNFSGQNGYGHTTMYGGPGNISGLILADIDGKYKPAYARLLLLDEYTRLVIRELWSDPDTGMYTFEALDTNRPFTVLAYDLSGKFLSVTMNRRFAQRPET